MEQLWLTGNVIMSARGLAGCATAFSPSPHPQSWLLWSLLRHISLFCLKCIISFYSMSSALCHSSAENPPAMFYLIWNKSSGFQCDHSYFGPVSSASSPLVFILCLTLSSLVLTGPCWVLNASHTPTSGSWSCCCSTWDRNHIEPPPHPKLMLKLFYKRIRH